MSVYMAGMTVSPVLESITPEYTRILHLQPQIALHFYYAIFASFAIQLGGAQLFDTQAYQQMKVGKFAHLHQHNQLIINDLHSTLI